MYRTNADLLLASMAAWNRGDREGWLETFDREAEWHPYITAIERSVYRGHEGLTKMWEAVHDEFDTIEVRPEEPEELSDRLLTRMEFVGVGRASGAEIRRLVFQIATFRDAKILRIEMYGDEADALEAAGGGEQPPARRVLPDVRE